MRPVFRSMTGWMAMWLLVGGLAGGWHLRTRDWHLRVLYPAFFFCDNEPILTTPDGYYYLRYAVDLIEHRYDKIDTLRLAPTPPPRPWPPPLLSVLTALTIRMTGTPPGWAGTWLPPVLSLLLAIPVFFLGRKLGGILMAAAATFFCLLAPFLIAQTGLGRLDTEALNAFFMLNTVWIMYQVAQSQGRTRGIWLLAGVFNLGLFLWWWDMARTTVIFLHAVLLALWGCVEGWRHKSIKTLWWMALGTSLLTGLLLIPWDGRFSILSNLLAKGRYIIGSTAGPYPNISPSINEQARLSFVDMARQITGGLAAFAVCITGVMLLMWRQRLIALLQLPMLAIGLAGVLFAQRFLVFLIPLLAMGFGYVMSFFWKEGSSKSRTLAGWGVLLICFTGMILHAPKGTFKPAISPQLAQGFKSIGTHTPENAVIWSWWDNGYPIMYWANRATISDGGAPRDQLCVFNAWPYTATNCRAATDWMRAYVAFGRKAMQPWHTAIQQGLPPPSHLNTNTTTRPLYLVTDEKMLISAFWWYWFGTWDPARHEGRHPHYQAYQGIRQDDDILACGTHFSIRRSNGHFTDGISTQQLSQLWQFEQDGWHRRFYTQNGPVFEFNPDMNFALYCSEDIFPSLFNQLYFLGIADPACLTPVVWNGLYFQLWKIVPR